MIPNHPSQAQAADQIAFVDAMMDRGRRAAADDGVHLIVWGALATLSLLAQYVAEVRDWAPSAVLWRWQPVFLLGCLLSLGVSRRFGAGRVRDNAATRTYRTAFAAALITVASYLLGAGSAGRPDPVTAVVVLCGTLGAAFLVASAATGLRWLTAVAAAWWALLMWFAARDRLVLTDFFVLAGATTLLLFGPGLRLAWTARRSRDATLPAAVP